MARSVRGKFWRGKKAVKRCRLLWHESGYANPHFLPLRGKFSGGSARGGDEHSGRSAQTAARSRRKSDSPILRTRRRAGWRCDGQKLVIHLIRLRHLLLKAEKGYSMLAERRADFFSEWCDLSASILFFARRERLRFWRRIFSISARRAAMKPFLRSSILSSNNRRAMKRFIPCWRVS